MYRRRVLAGLAAGMTLFAGCNGGSNDGGGDSGNNTTQSTDGAGTTSGDSGPATTVATATAGTPRETTTHPTTATSASTSLATSTPASVPPTTSASPLTSETTVAGTAVPGTATGTMDIDLSHRETYTNNVWSYTIEYPAGWSVDDGDPSEVIIYPPSASELSPFTGLLVSIEDENVPSSATLDQLTTKRLREIKQYNRKENIRTDILSRQYVTLPNDRQAILSDILVNPPGGTESQRFSYITALATNILYVASFGISEKVYTSTIGHYMDDISASLTVSGGSTATTSS